MSRLFAGTISPRHLAIAAHTNAQKAGPRAWGRIGFRPRQPSGGDLLDTVWDGFAAQSKAYSRVRPKPPVITPAWFGGFVALSSGTTRSRGECGVVEVCGAEGDRTPDLMTASHALSQLSYGPVG